MIWLVFLWFGPCSAVVVETKDGSVKGYSFTTRNGREVLVFSGIPYATPPVGTLRFKDPLPIKPWKGVIDAKVSTFCLQYIHPYHEDILAGEEDCLYLTVFTPKLNTTILYPVMVYFHGGSFITGAGQAVHGAQYIMDHDVVIVQVEYRLGAFGFLSMEDDILAGNMGLKDQVMALKWVQYNIVNFMGDPNKVTLMGDSAGSASTHYHMISPMSRGLFHAAISESGVSLAPWAYLVPGEARKLALKTARALVCPNENIYEMVKCFQSKNAKDIFTSFKRNDFPVANGNPLFIFLPIIDSNSTTPFLPKDPHQMESLSIPWLTGCNNLDGFVLSGYFVSSYSYIDLYVIFDMLFNELAPLFLFYYPSDNSTEISNLIRNHYFGNQSITKHSLKNLTDLFTDRYFFWPMMESLKLHKGQSYVYEFLYNSNTSYQFDFTPKRVLNGSSHGDQTIFLWNMTYRFHKPLEGSDLELSNRMVKLVVDFIKYRTPTPAESGFDWPLWDNVNETFISIGYKGNFAKKQKFYQRRMHFWLSLKRKELFQNI